MRFIQFKRLLAMLILPWALAIALQTAGRAFLLMRYGSGLTLAEQGHDIATLFTIGLRFDIRMASILFGGLFLLSLLSLATSKIHQRWLNALPWLSAGLLTVVALLTVANIYYYATYDRHIDLFIFGLLEDDTKAILQTLWSDYPVIRGVLGLGLFAYAMVWLNRRWQRAILSRLAKRNSVYVRLPVILLTFLLILIGARGSLTTFPLRHADAQISNVKIINDFTPNAVIALNWAYKDYENNNTFAAATDDDGSALLGQFLGQPTPASLAPFQAQTAANAQAEKTPPNVVLAVMESFGTHLLQYDTPQRDLYGALRSHWQQDWHFERFVSEGDGTIDSLNRFFVRSPMSSVSQSSAQKMTFASNMFQPYKDQGYRIVYITPGNGAWRNLNQFLVNLGVDEFVEQNTLKQRYPEAEVGPWGVPDEYMFRFAEARLSQAEQDGQPVFIMMMSVSHHPPYKLPDHQARQNFALSADEAARFSNLAEGKALVEVFNTFRYANDQLGQFLGWVKTQPKLAHNTIVAATGDHNIRGVNYPDAVDLALHHAVPFYLYVPQPYREGRRYDPSRVGSHKDIMPTLYALSLSNTPFYQTGCNLLAQVPDQNWCQLGYNPNVFLTPEGAYNPSNDSFRPWADAQGLALAAQPATPQPSTQAVIDRWQAFTPLLAWQLNRQVQDAKAK
ncbi:MAG: LTA synthase family protein [Neisseriaceae bacterium]|nr:LTA synthase family protein [Neisseriaceae bacterium]